MALIITIIILILLAAISINAVFKAGIIDTATDAAIKYEKEQYREKEILDDLDNTIKDALNEIGENTGTTGNNKPVFASAPVGTAVANTNNQMIIEAMATDADENDILTYTLWFGTSETDLEETTLTAESKQGNTISFTQTGLDNDTRYYFKVAVSDGVCEDVISDGNNQRTWCKGEYCSGISYTNQMCTKCDSNHKINCSLCNGQGQIACNGLLKGTPQSGYLASGSAVQCSFCYQYTPIGYYYYVLSYSCQSCGTTSYDWKPYCSSSCATSASITKRCSQLVTCNMCQGSGRIKCTSCKGEGYLSIAGPCKPHSISGVHYYCTSGLSHGKNVSQYH